MDAAVCVLQVDGLAMHGMREPKDGARSAARRYSGGLESQCIHAVYASLFGIVGDCGDKAEESAGSLPQFTLLMGDNNTVSHVVGMADSKKYFGDLGFF